ncbi:cytochrome P450 [Ephemerocybe angulata]|uniref:Cytochrome P450 n=1 Tax=Ephemerocybe angulata TaxID=980116 RepID=A0A8H6H6V5_9AGAR|nr:cytochrome P450 [Tulosesus angulatus]
MAGIRLSSCSTRTIAALLGVSSVLVASWKLCRRGAKRKRLPPGPPRTPFLGHLFRVPRELPWVKYHDMCRELGSDVVALEVLGTTIIVLDSAEAVNELLERRSHIYSSRPHLPMICDLMGWEFNIGLMPYGERSLVWRMHRKMFHQSFQSSAVTSFHPQEVKAARQLVQNLYQRPEDFTTHFRLMAGYVVLSAAYGIEPLGEDDPYIKISEEAIHYLVEAAVPGAFLVDIIPAMRYIPKWMPFAHFQRFAETSRNHIEKMRQSPYEEAKSSSGMSSSFVQKRLKEMDHTGDTEAYEEVVMNTASAMFVGGFDTIIAAMSALLFAMMTHPEAQRRAQAEIDSVISSGLPTFEDRKSLPYITAIVKEVLRWKPVTPMAAAHVLEVDDEYRGHFLPAGSLVIGNAWAILSNEATYPDPFSFRPDRFLAGKDGSMNPCPDPDFAFGFGRRVCPGRLMALGVLWISIASILTVYDISKGVDKHGHDIQPVYEPGPSSLVFMPLPFTCTIKPRNAKAELVCARLEDWS